MAGSGNSTATLVNHLEYNAFGTITSPDWAKGMYVKDDPLHGTSKWLGGTGVTTLASLGMSNFASSGVLRLAKGKNSAAICAPTTDFARYGGAQQRQALLNQVRASGSLSEAKGVVHSFREMKRLGYELQDVSLNYRGNQGLDLIFRNGSRYAVVEAKHGKYLSLLKMYKGGL